MGRIRFLVIATLVVAAVVVTACSDDGSSDDIGALDAAIAAIEAGDGAALADQAVLSEIACTHADGLGGPPKCGPGQSEGTIVAVLPAAACEGYYLQAGEIAGSTEALLSTGPKVHSAYRTSGLGDILPAGYVILLDVDSPQFGGKIAHQVYLNDEGVTGLFFGCGHTVEELIDSQQLQEQLALAD